MAQAICGDDDALLAVRPALIISGNELVLRAISAQRVAAIDRLCSAHFLRRLAPQTALHAHVDRSHRPPVEQSFGSS